MNRSSSSVIRSVLALLLAVVMLPTSTLHADTLSPQRIQELTDLGAQIADREKAMKEAEQQLQDPNISPATRDRLTKEVGDHRDFIKNTKDGIAAQGQDQKRVLDRAIEARQKQHQLREAEAKAKADPNDKKAQRTANRLSVELKNDYKDLGTLPPLASAAMPGSGTAGQALAAAAVLLDECNRAVLLASESSEKHVTTARPPVSSSSIHLIRLFGSLSQRPSVEQPPVRRVSESLTPDEIRKAQKDGIDHADQQFEKAQLDKIPKGSRTPEQNKRLDDLNDMLKDYENGKNSPFANKEAIDVMEKAAQARWMQRQAEALRASGTPGSAQAAQGLENQAKQLLGVQNLPPLRASAEEPLQFSSASGQTGAGTRLVAAGQSGYAQVVSSVSAAAGQVGIKGHSHLTFTGDIRQQTNAELDLDQLAHLEEEPSETSNFAQYLGYDYKLGSWGKPNFNLSAQWSNADAEPPHVATVGQDGGFDFKKWNPSANLCYRMNYAYGFDHVSTPISPSNTAASYEFTVNANPSYIAAFNSPGIADKFFGDAMSAGAVNGSRYSWTGFYTGINEAPFIATGQISDDGYNHLAWDPNFRNFMAWGERNPGGLPDPVPGLSRDDWPHTDAEAIPSFTLPGRWLED